MPPKPQDQGCLKGSGAGCFTIRDRYTCLTSKDKRGKDEWMGLRISDEPCVWCGGGPCHNNNTNLCEPYDFLYHGLGVGFHYYMTKEHYEVAHCVDGEAALAPPTAADLGAAPAAGMPSAFAQPGAGAAPAASAQPSDAAEAATASTEPADVAEDDCWWKCGEESGNCPSFCGEGRACCRSGVLGDAAECAGLSPGAFSSVTHHVCVEKVEKPATVGAALGVRFGIRGPASAGPGNQDVIAHRNAANETNETAVANGEGEGAGGIPAWIWILNLALALLVGVPLLAYLFCRGRKQGAAKKAKKSKRGARDVSVEMNKDAPATDAAELEMQAPLVQAQERSVKVDQGGDLFDAIDRNHDGVISQDEFNRAVVLQQAPAAVPLATPAMPTVSYQVVAPVMTLVPRATVAAPVAGPAVAQRMTSISVAPVATVQPGVPGGVTVAP